MKPTCWRFVLVAVAAVLIWVVHFDRWTVESWSVPTEYYGDAPETLARLKMASEGEIFPLQPQVISRLGAPFGAYWNAYPAPDKPLMLALGALVHVFNLPMAANLGFLLAQVMGALAFYGVARWLRVRWEWAAAGGLLFAYTYHTFHRGLGHFSLVFTWTVPLGLAAVWLIAGSRRIKWKGPPAVACLGAGVALGTSNPYNLLFWLQLMGWALLWQWFSGRRRTQNLQIGVVTIAVSLLCFIIVHAEMWLHVETPDAVPLLARNYGGTEVYALKPVEMFIPPPYHQWDWLAFFGNRYARWSPWRGEVFLPYLGLAGIAGFIWLSIASIRRIMARRAPSGHALSIGWIIIYSAIGGVTNLLALFLGFQIFRATNRAAIFVSAFVLFFLVSRLSRLTLRWPPWLQMGGAAALTAIGVFEQLPKAEPMLAPSAIGALVKADVEFGEALEGALPDGAMVFQLPVINFPEGIAPHGLGEYEHFRPYFATETLHFSYGAVKMRSRSRWQREVEGLPVPELVNRLERYGFAALYLNRKGLENRGEKIVQELAMLGYTQAIECPGGDQVAVLLRPSGTPELPTAESLTFGSGWHLSSEAGWRWAYEDAAMSWFNPHDHPIQMELRLNAAGVTARELTLERDGDPVHRFAVAGQTGSPVVVRLELVPGVNRFKLCSDLSAVRQGAGSNQLKSFGVEESSIRMFPPAIAVLAHSEKK